MSATCVQSVNDWRKQQRGTAAPAKWGDVAVWMQSVEYRAMLAGLRRAA
jgi:hypothetical protein